MGDSHRNTQLVKTSDIRVNHKKLRKHSQAKIGRYAREYERGDAFPPISVNDFMLYSHLLIML